MTNEEAIKWFQQSAFYHEKHEPFNMAIKALSQQNEDAISRQATLEPYKVLNDTDTLCVALIRANIMQQPSVNPQEPKTGHWIIDKGSLDALYGEVCKCSECGGESIGTSDFCPDCGAKMEEPQESEE